VSEQILHGTSAQIGYTMENTHRRKMKNRLY